MSGRTISHYELQEVLGEGAMGRVYRAHDTVLERHVALKLIAPALAGDQAFTERFLREARLAAQLNHPNIATVYEFGVEAGETFLVMELVEGETLAERVQRGPCSFAEVRSFGAQAAAALAAAHARGIVHRDIKPGNLMITRDGLLKIMDFGIARRAGDVHLTSTGALVGTPRTMAPEILRGQEPGPAADLFALGCVLFELLTGRPPFDAAEPMAVLYQIAHEDPRLRALRTDLPEDLVVIVEGLLVKDPARRWGPAAAVAAALSGAATAGSIPGTSFPLAASADPNATVAFPLPGSATGSVAGSSLAGGSPPSVSQPRPPSSSPAGTLPERAAKKPRDTGHTIRTIVLTAGWASVAILSMWWGLWGRDREPRNRPEAVDVTRRGVPLVVPPVGTPDDSAIAFPFEFVPGMDPNVAKTSPFSEERLRIYEEMRELGERTRAADAATAAKALARLDSLTKLLGTVDDSLDERTMPPGTRPVEKTLQRRALPPVPTLPAPSAPAPATPR